MRILISNDDGIHARGIRTLAKRLSEDPGNVVYVVAPDRERSATGHALTLHKPLRVDEVQIEGNVKGAWSTTGTPSDCVKFAVCHLMENPPQLVISGINSGANLGSDVLYSGTVSAAMEGAILNIPSVAVSLAGKHSKHFDVAANFIFDLIKNMPVNEFSSHTLLNINVPNKEEAEIEGVAITELCLRVYNDMFEKRMDPRGKVYYWFHGQPQEQETARATDVYAIAHNQISITPISFNMTDHRGMAKLNNSHNLQKLISIWGKSISSIPKDDPVSS